MKKIIGLLVFTIFTLGCTSEESSEKIVNGHWSTESFELYVYAKQRAYWDDVNKKWIYGKIENYANNEEFRWHYDKKEAMFYGHYVLENKDKIMKWKFYMDQKNNFDYYDFTIDKKIDLFSDEGQLSQKDIYYYR